MGSRKTRYTDVEYLKHVYTWANILLIAPPRSFKLNDKQRAKTYKLFVLVNSLFISLCFVISIMGQWHHMFPLLHGTTVVCESIYFNLVTIMHLLSTLQSGFGQRKYWDRFLEKCIQLDQNALNNSQINWRLKLKFAVCYVSLSLLLVYDGYILIYSFGLEIFLYYIYGRVQYYFLLVMVLLICNFALALKIKFEHLNGMILNRFNYKEHFSEKLSFKCDLYHEELHKIDKSNTAVEFTELFSDLCELVCLLNKIFGWNILFLLGIAMLSLLNSTNLLIILSVTGEVPGRSESGSALLVLTFSLTGVIVIWTIFVIVFCDGTNKEIQKTSLVCYMILTETEISIESEQQLHMLAEQASLVCPQLSAANVFNINITTLFAFVGVLISYIIVFIPFDMAH